MQLIQLVLLYRFQQQVDYISKAYYFNTGYKISEIFALYETSPVEGFNVGLPGNGEDTVYGALKTRGIGSTGGL